MGTIIDASCNSILDLHADAWAAEDVPFRSITVVWESVSHQTGSINIGNESCESQKHWVANRNTKQNMTRM